VGSELNRLAPNEARARNVAGFHWRPVVQFPDWLGEELGLTQRTRSRKPKNCPMNVLN
jgi:hypothetical protein